MRLWSIHPSYLDAKGLVAVWREGLLALAVLQGRTKGYTNHPQLARFKNHAQPIAAITVYLHHIVNEADERGYKFDRTKLTLAVDLEPIMVTSGQLLYETQHLKTKLNLRDKNAYQRYFHETSFAPHPVFAITPGKIEQWEKVGNSSKPSSSWFVYILLCADGSLYTGCTTDVAGRFAAHTSGTGARYTRMHKPLRVVYTQAVPSRSEAQKLEAEIKKWSRSRKITDLHLQLES